MRNSLAVRLERVVMPCTLRELAQEGIAIAGRLNAPVIIRVADVDLLVHTSDSVQDVLDRFDRFSRNLLEKMSNDTRRKA